MRNEIKSIEKVMERLVARSNAGFNIYDEVFEINEILKKLKGESNMNLLEIIENIEFTGGYHIIYTNTDDMGYLRHIKKLDNAKFGGNHWVIN